MCPCSMVLCVFLGVVPHVSLVPCSMVPVCSLAVALWRGVPCVPGMLTAAGPYGLTWHVDLCRIKIQARASPCRHQLDG